MIRRPPTSTLFPLHDALPICSEVCCKYSTKHGTKVAQRPVVRRRERKDRKRTRLNSSHTDISRMPSFVFNDTATTDIYTLSPTRRSSDLFRSLLQILDKTRYEGCATPGCTSEGEE